MAALDAGKQGKGLGGEAGQADAGEAGQAIHNDGVSVMVALNEARITPGMSPISVLLNLLWIIFGDLWMAAGWIIAAIVMAITIIGLPWTRAAFNIAVYTLLPFGQKAVSRAADGQHDLGMGPLGFFGNVLWLILAGWWLA